MITRPAPLAVHHRLDGFDSGVASLDDWLKRRALKNQANGSSRTYVICEGEDVIGYYCLAAGGIGHAEAPPAMRRNRPDPIPVLVLGRLAIHRNYHQHGLGTALLRDAIQRTLQAADIAGITALLVHALSEDAKRFYRSRGFLESPIQPMTLCLMLATVKAALK
ncbi:GNAT family N-acetyltransferase [Nitrospirillum sp. BR 11163]|uniref:GNAT family N-acetyltransferase n=1 Tax=Nitrospirillum sp. BR 11163 TaxID=3104323 RepID=UPI002AFE5243|nr:GNAT family N-acetyltransferase [Nitrospirillum sp. BR 11163]MEA1676218.1 GNAT family N-acetyltransferase [Nitrospirillum sp. BR 11163]